MSTPNINIFCCSTISVIPLLLINLTFSIGSAQSQPSGYRLSRREYVDKYRDHAVREMLLHDIPASITMAQAILESDNGNSPLAAYANNHFGIKCHVGWNGMEFYKDDDANNECFRKYSAAIESYEDHSAFLKTRPRYRNLFNLSKTDYKGWANGLREAGYATNPKYGDILIAVIEEQNLYELDKITTIPTIRHSTPMAASPKFGKREILLNNRVKYVVAREGDSYFKIATDMEMMLWEIFKYNDLQRTGKLKRDQIIYIQPKRNKSFIAEYHLVRPGETLFDISQMYAVKLRKLLKINGITQDSKLETGQKVWLKKVRSKK